jgi:hypothetical protein
MQQIKHVIGVRRTIGKYGPVYFVREAICQLDNQDWLMKVVLIETGDEVLYNLSEILQHPVVA